MNLKFIKKALRWLAITILLLLLIPVIISGLLLINSVQNWVVDKATVYATEMVGSEVSINTIYLKPFTDVEINDILIRDYQNDTLIYAQHISVSLLHFSLDSSSVDLGQVTVDHGYFNLIKYQGDSLNNLAYFIERFPKSEDTSNTVFTIRSDGLELIDGRFKYQNQNVDLNSLNQIDFNHLDISRISGSFSDVEVIADSVAANVDDLRLIEQSGFRVRQLDASIVVSSSGVITESLLLETNEGIINGRFAMSTDTWSSYSNFLEEVLLDADLVESTVVFNDLTFFAPQVKDLLTPLHFTGHVTGTVSNLNAEVDSLGFLNSGVLKGKIRVKGLPEVSRTFLDADISRFYSSFEDALKVNIPTGDSLINLSFPDHIMQLDYVSYRGRFTGFVNDFVAFGSIKTALGTAVADINIKTNDGFDYSGSIASDGFKLGQLIQVPQSVGQVSLNLTVNGSGVEPKTMRVKANGTVQSIELLNYRYTNVSIDGELANLVFNGNLGVKDTNIRLGFKGAVDFNSQLPLITADFDVQKLALAPLNLVPSDTHGVFSGNLKLQLKGSSSDDIHGMFRLIEPSYRNEDYVLGLDSVLLIDNLFPGGHEITLKSDILNAAVKGRTNLIDLPVALLKVGNHYMPNYVNQPDLAKVDTLQSFTYNLEVLNEREWLGFFIPNLKSSNIYLSGELNMNRNEFTMCSDTITAAMKSTKINGIVVDAWSSDEHLYLNFNVHDLVVSEELELDNLIINNDIHNDTLNTDIHWRNLTERADSGGVNFMVFRMQNSSWKGVLNALEIRLAQTNWKSIRPATFETDSVSLSINKLDLVSENGRIKCDGTVDQMANTRLELLVQNFDLSYLSDFGLVSKPLAGLLASEFNLSYLDESLVLDGNVRVDSIAYDGVEFGDAIGLATYSSELKRIDMDLDLKYLGQDNFSLIGEYYPEKQREQLDIEIGLTDFQLKALEPFVAEFVSNVVGSANGSISVTGSTSRPDLNGAIKLKELSTHVNYLNTDYAIPNAIVNIEPDMITMDHALVRDIKGDSAYATAQVFHEYFQDITYDLFVQAYNFQGLNTTLADNDQYYGEANVTGDINIGGYKGHTIIDVDASTDPNTMLSIPLSTGGEVSEFDYIRFVDSNQFNTVYSDKALNEELNGLEMNFKLDVDNDAQVQIIFDEKVGDIIKVRGNGDMLMAIDNRGKFSMYGDYLIEKGDYLFTLQNVVNKRFNVKPGSRLTWNGDPLNAQLDLTAIYSLKASPAVMVYAMAGDQGTANAVYDQRLPTDVSLYMAGPLTAPKIEFGVKLPTLADGDIANQLLDPAIASKDQRTSQAFSLLLANQFSAGNGAVALGGAGQSSGYEVLSNQLSNWLSQYSENFDIGVSYRDGYVDDTGQEMAGQTEVSVSRELFNNRVKVEVNGTVQGTTENQEEQANNVAGEFNVEYKINKDGSLRARVFNESNQQSAANLNQAPYTQGVGIFYRKEFNTWGEFFRGFFGADKSND